MRVLIQSKEEVTFSPALLWRPRTGAGEREKEKEEEKKKSRGRKVKRLETGGRKKAKVFADRKDNRGWNAKKGVWKSGHKPGG